MTRNYTKLFLAAVAAVATARLGYADAILPEPQEVNPKLLEVIDPTTDVTHSMANLNWTQTGSSGNAVDGILKFSAVSGFNGLLTDNQFVITTTSTYTVLGQTHSTTTTTHTVTFDLSKFEIDYDLHVTSLGVVTITGGSIDIDGAVVNYTAPGFTGLSINASSNNVSGTYVALTSSPELIISFPTSVDPYYKGAPGALFAELKAVNGPGGFPTGIQLYNGSIAIIAGFKADVMPAVPLPPAFFSGVLGISALAGFGWWKKKKQSLWPKV